jgi:hypothetical protein
MNPNKYLYLFISLFCLFFSDGNAQESERPKKTNLGQFDCHSV